MSSGRTRSATTWPSVGVASRPELDRLGAVVVELDRGLERAEQRLRVWSWCSNRVRLGRQLEHLGLAGDPERAHDRLTERVEHAHLGVLVLRIDRKLDGQLQVGKRPLGNDTTGTSRSRFATPRVPVSCGIWTGQSRPISAAPAGSRSFIRSLMKEARRSQRTS